VNLNTFITRNFVTLGNSLALEANGRIK